MWGPFAGPTLALVLIPLYVLGTYVSHMVNLWRYEPPRSSITLSFVGDLMFDRYIRERAERTSYDAIITDALPLFASTTLLFGNLEGSITTFTPVADYRDSGPNHYRFTFATTVAQTLFDAGFNAMSLANNHSLDFGRRGLEQTIEWLSLASLGVFGIPTDPYTPWRTATSGHSIAVYGYDPWNADAATLNDHLQQEGPDHFVIVFAHWGNEYTPLPSALQVERARQFVDSGADLVIGAHPHVVQTKEQYNGAWIYYSLGNFIFDQYFSDEVRCGAVVHVTLHATSTPTVSESFVELARDGTTKPSTCLIEVPLSE